MANFIVPLAVIFFICFTVYCIISSMKPVKLKQNKCKKNPDKDCPYIVEMDCGGMRAYGHFQCCQVKDQLKALNRLIVASDEYDGNAGEFHFSKEMRERAKREQKQWEEFDSSGPTE